MNKYIASGNICKDIELRKTNSGKSVISNTIAVKNDFKNANGEYDSEFINIVVWNNDAEFLNKYAHKGDKLLIEGRLTNRTYDKNDGSKGYITEIVCSNVELLGSKKEDKSNASAEEIFGEENITDVEEEKEAFQRDINDLSDSLPF